MTTGSTPYSCNERGRSSAANWIIRTVFAFRSTSVRDVIISLTYSPPPYDLHSRRNAVLVIPAIGASTTGGSATTRSESRTGEVTSAVIAVPTVPTAPLLIRILGRRNRLDDGRRQDGRLPVRRAIVAGRGAPFFLWWRSPCRADHADDRRRRISRAARDLVARQPERLARRAVRDEADELDGGVLQ